MSNWRDQILTEFTPRVSRLTLVADPDGLLLEEGILEGIRERGFELIPFEDHIAFRYAYESKFRSRWDRGEHTDLVVVLRSEANDLGSLPYDLLQAGRRLSFNLSDIFPSLSYSVVAALDRGDLDALHEAQQRHAPGRLGENASKEFILRHVFEIATELIKQPSDLLRILLRRHYLGQRIPKMLDERFVQLIGQNIDFDDWPVERLCSDREIFFKFLQERWPIFLDNMVSNGKMEAMEDGKPLLTLDGPSELPFDHHDIRGYIDNLFLEGLLHSIPHPQADLLSKTWASVGVKSDPTENKLRRITKLIDSLQTSIPANNAKHTDWFHFARGWTELNLLVNEQPDTLPEETRRSIESLRGQVDASFNDWVSKRFAGLINLPPAPPVMLHHLPRFLARQVGQDDGTKIALLLVDGLAMEQWVVMREALISRDPSFRFREMAVFAWIPSITSVSRQAAFAGRPPLFFPNSIQTTEKESTLWKQFWMDQGFQQMEVVFAKGLGNGNVENISDVLSHPKVRVAGLVVDKVDRIMHGMELGASGMHNQVRQWAQQPYLSAVLNLLLAQGFIIYMTSDHGNIEAKGCGRPAEGVIADLRGERVRIYPDAALREKVKSRFPTAIEWDPAGLPEDYLALLAPSRRAFVSEQQRIVSHGGISLEEIIVPLVQVERGGK